MGQKYRYVSLATGSPATSARVLGINPAIIALGNKRPLIELCNTMTYTSRYIGALVDDRFFQMDDFLKHPGIHFLLVNWRPQHASIIVIYIN
jgi:hypothetical protein